MTRNVLFKCESTINTMRYITGLNSQYKMEAVMLNLNQLFLKKNDLLQTLSDNLVSAVKHMQE